MWSFLETKGWKHSAPHKTQLLKPNPIIYIFDGSETLSWCDTLNHRYNILLTAVVNEISSVSSLSSQSDTTFHQTQTHTCTQHTHCYTHSTLCKQTLTRENRSLDHHHAAVNTDVLKIMSCNRNRRG